jgi:uncharacterized protein YdeI (YjbR/CyaY-like superfamily)
MATGTSVTFEPRNTAELANFFKTSRDSYHEIWIVITKKEHVDPQPVTFIEAVAEALKQGLIDSRTKSLNEHKYLVRFTKRKKRRADARTE